MDEALLIGQTAKEADEAQAAQGSGRSGIQVPQDIVPVSVFGEFKQPDENGQPVYVEYKTTAGVPRGTNPEDVASFVMLRHLQTGLFKTLGSAGEVNFYPLDQFKRFTSKPSTVVGVQLP